MVFTAIDGILRAERQRAGGLMTAIESGPRRSLDEPRLPREAVSLAGFGDCTPPRRHKAAQPKVSVNVGEAMTGSPMRGSLGAAPPTERSLRNSHILRLLPTVALIRGSASFSPLLSCRACQDTDFSWRAWQVGAALPLQIESDSNRSPQGRK
ncbi:hypothetical protein DF3PA_40156 [Candidatus Defluviicoccus seviourii]|uniref:Uncharacterized protein n=1 Tax=Candidatus Defluviicoccus seviourii TaxID=2565273 RepID=A0A564WFL7_9PROT|nr:hypothetical protein DF3PA_40156 [Candidatus Defluviicoccus seviourii]